MASKVGVKKEVDTNRMSTKDIVNTHFQEVDVAQKKMKVNLKTKEEVAATLQEFNKLCEQFMFSAEGRGKQHAITIAALSRCSELMDENEKLKTTQVSS